MYIRFVINKNDYDSGKRLGVFQAIADLKDKGKLLNHELKLLSEIHKWFNKNLNKPHNFSKSRKPNAQAKAISWYKDTAQEHITKMHEIVAILESHNVHVEIVKTERPGYIIFEDRYQVTAEPYKDTKT